jgi:hypothetical protein
MIKKWYLLVFLMLLAVLPFTVGAQEIQDTQEETGWQNNRLYMRVSLNYPLTYYTLQSTGLIGGTGVYDGTDPTDLDWKVSPLGNRHSAFPEITLGLEIRFLDWMSIEPIIQAGIEHLNDNNFIGLAAGLNLMFPFKFAGHILLQPYGSGVFPLHLLTRPDIFDSFPLFGFGGGLQVGIMGGWADSIFFDFHYLYFGNVGVKNPYTGLYPKPPVIYYHRTVIGLGIGFKIGIFDKK